MTFHGMSERTEVLVRFHIQTSRLWWPAFRIGLKACGFLVAFFVIGRFEWLTSDEVDGFLLQAVEIEVRKDREADTLRKLGRVP